MLKKFLSLFTAGPVETALNAALKQALAQAEAAFIEGQASIAAELKAREAALLVSLVQGILK